MDFRPSLWTGVSGGKTRNCEIAWSSLEIQLAWIIDCMIIAHESTINKYPIKKKSSNYHVIFK